MRFAEVDRLLDPAPMSLEMGWERLEGGVLHVAIRTDMHGCSGKMFDWWFRFRPTTREYVWWHPIDHIASEWIETREGTAVGSIHQVEERFTDAPAEALSIQFHDPRTVFDPAAYDAALASGAISGAICARGGRGFSPQRDPSGAVIGTRLIHLCRDTPWGLALRTHFFMGQDLPALGMPEVEMRRAFPDAYAPNLLQHCYDEFTFLSRFLPSLYVAENRETVRIVRPW